MSKLAPLVPSGKSKRMRKLANDNFSKGIDQPFLTKLKELISHVSLDL